MDLTPDTKARIDRMSYQQLLGRWRDAPSTDTIFQGESGDYFAQRMSDLRAGADHVAASKAIGWDR